MSKQVSSVDLERDIYTARLRAVDSKTGFPCLSYALMSLEPIIDEHIPRAGTDRWWRVYVNPHFFSSLTADQGAMVLVHEVWHLLSDHHRRADRIGVRPNERYTWNLAGDCEINTKDNLWRRLPENCIKPAGYGFPDNLLAEEYFIMLKEQGIGMSADFKGEPGSGDCGSCAHGMDEGYQNPGPDDEGGSGTTETRAKIIKDETARRIIDEASKNIGNVPAGWVRWAKKTLKSEVDWRAYLRNTISGMIASTIGKSIPTYRRMARRQYKYPDFIIPAYQDPVPHVAMIIDTSGSMSDSYVGQGIAEVDGILQTLGLGIAVDVYFTDAKAYDAQRVTSASSLTPYGGGGTDMCEGFKAIEAKSKLDPSSDPSLIICVTDGLTGWPVKPPKQAQVCVVLVGKSGISAPWAKPPLHHTLRIGVKIED